MASKIYSSTPRLTKLRQYINAQTSYTAYKCWSTTHNIYLRINDSDERNLGYIYYDTDTNTATSFIFEAREFDEMVVRVQKFKALFPTCIKLFRIGRYTYYRIDAVHGK